MTGTKRLKLKCDGLLSSFAFEISLRRYSEVHRKVARLADRFHGRGWKLRGSTQAVRRNDEVGPCRLTLSNTR